MIPPRLVLAALGLLLIAGLWSALQPARPNNSPSGGDIVLFRAVVERMKAGHSYYAAMNAELRDRGYPTASVVNWRLPATFMFVAAAPRVAHATVVTLGALGLVLGLLLFRNAPPLLTVIAGVVLIGASLAPGVPFEGLYMAEVWAGAFLLLSVLAYAFGAPRSAAACAIAAACARELALPFALIAMALAVYRGRTQELWWYIAGLAVILVYYGVHSVLAGRYIRPDDYGYATWMTFNGWPFVISTVGTGGWFLVLPLWTAAIGAVVILASLWSPADVHLKILVGFYFASFCVVGHSFNNYWGLMTGPSWGLAMVYGIMGLHRLARAA